MKVNEKYTIGQNVPTHLAIQSIYRPQNPTLNHSGIRKTQPLPLYGTKVPAGFPSPADPYIEQPLDLNEYLIHHPAATFFVRVSGHSMINAGIHDQDILIVDRSLEALPNKIVVAIIDGEMTVKRLKKNASGTFFLAAENPDYPSIQLKEGMDVTIWGVVTSVIHCV